LALGWPAGTQIKRKSWACLGGLKYCVFHEEPAVALSSFFFRYNSVFSYSRGVCGSFRGGKGGAFFFWGGGNFGEIGPLGQRALTESVRERERIFYFRALRQPAWSLGTPQEGGWWGGAKGVLPGVACRAPPRAAH
jgi:hypothetical protein